MLRKCCPRENHQEAFSEIVPPRERISLACGHLIGQSTLLAKIRMEEGKKGRREGRIIFPKSEFSLGSCNCLFNTNVRCS